MERLTEIKINRFQLNILLNDEEKETFNYIADNNVYCGTCRDVCEKGIEIEEIILDSLNDIRVKGTCRVCSGPVSRTIQFGENKEFFNRANDFRKYADQ